MSIARKASETCLVIDDLCDFDIGHILDCGQVFRYVRENDGFRIHAKDKTCFVISVGGRAEIHTEDIDFFAKYFDLENDYGVVKAELAKFDGMNEALKFGCGIRILNQDPVETVISFIISANNNIPRIKGIIERLCVRLGEKKIEKIGGSVYEYFAFPTLERLCEADEGLFKSIGAGYRANYLAAAAKQLCAFDFAKVQKMTANDAKKCLLGILGVGPKVADCILLFSFKKTDVFPVDTWVKKIYNFLKLPETEDAKIMAGNLVNRFGRLSGYAQQYLFFWFRDRGIKL